MRLTDEEKRQLKDELVGCLRDEPEVQRIVVFGSFLTSDDPMDMDVAVFQSSSEAYLPLALKYRRRVRPVSKRIAVDIVPVRPEPSSGHFLAEIESGEVLYER